MSRIDGVTEVGGCEDPFAAVIEKAKTAFDAKNVMVQNHMRQCTRLEGVIRFLWDLLDDIDTMDDAARSDDLRFRDVVREIQQRRWLTGITTNGQKLDITQAHAPATLARGDYSQRPVEPVRSAPMVSQEEIWALIGKIEERVRKLETRGDTYGLLRPR